MGRQQKYRARYKMVLHIMLDKEYCPVLRFEER